MDSHALIGTELGPCTLLQLLGQGGTGAVFLADHAELREQVAVKVIAPPASQLEPNEMASFLAGFRRMASEAATLAHPHILPVIEYGVQDGLGYLVMPFLGFEPLGAVMSRAGPFAPEVCADYLGQLADALTYAHAQGILHGNITPLNILAGKVGGLVLTDFGQGMALRAPRLQASHLAQAFRISPYRAPEQLLGGRLDERTDLYALGVLLFEMLTGATPYSGASASELLMQQLQQSPPSPREVRPDVPKACARVLMRALAREPAHRFARAEELAAAFRLALAYHQQSLTTTEPQTSEHALPGEEPAAPVDRHLPAPASLSIAAPHLSHSPNVGQQDEQNVRARPFLPEREDGGGADAQLGEPVEERANAALVQVLSSEGAERQRTPTPIESAAPARVGSGQHQTPPPPFPPVAGPFLTQRDLRRIAALPWPITRRGAPTAPRHRTRLFALYAAILVIGVVTVSLLRGSLPGSHQGASELPGGAPPGQATLFADPLTRASHSPWWPTVPATVYSFTRDAYVITGASLEGTFAVLAAPLWESPITYSITARASSGSASATFFGILLRCSSLDEEGSPQACYSFEVTLAGAYRFYKYDALTFAQRQAGPSAEWSLLWQRPIGPEFHEAAGSLNTLTVVEEQQAFIMLINGKRVGQVGDASYHGGMVGIIVGGPGAIVAFSRLSVSRM